MKLELWLQGAGHDMGLATLDWWTELAVMDQARYDQAVEDVQGETMPGNQRGCSADAHCRAGRSRLSTEGGPASAPNNGAPS